MGGWNIVYALINFAILAFVLVKFGKKMVVNMINGNRQQISDALDAAKAAGENAQHITETLEDIRAEGQAQSQEIVSQARERSAKSLSQSAQARQELAESRRKQTRQDALSLKRQVLGQLRDEKAEDILSEAGELLKGADYAQARKAMPARFLKALEEKNDMESRGRLENVQELKSNILGFLEQDPEDATLSGFLNEIALYTDLDNVEADDNCVTMMTIHSAKGLEFPAVYVVGMEEGIFPGSSAQYDPEELEEERRLCYVAMTRAKEKLTLTNCRQRMLYGRTSANKASRFLDEIPEDNMRWESKPEPRFGGMEHDSTFGGDRYEGGFGGASYGGGYGSRSAGGSSWSSGGVHSYRDTAAKTPPQRTLQSVRKNTASAAPLMQLQQGDMVEHTAFGKGMVLSVRPMGGDALVEVAFDQVGAKKLMLKSAGSHMKKL